MKTIIVPTDYSPNAYNATKYAAQLAKVHKAKLVLLHAYHLPAIIEGVPVPFTSLQNLNREHKVHIERLAKKISSEYEIEVISKVYPGFITEVLPDFVSKYSGELVVLGMRGMSNVEEILFGSVATHILKKAKFPLLIVPPSVHYTPIKNILLACDYHADAVNIRYSILKELAKRYNAQIRVLHIGEPEVEMAELVERVETGQHIDRILKGVNHSFLNVQEDDIEEGIKFSIKTAKTDLLVMAPRKRTFWQSLTSSGKTQKIALHIDIPLLALPHTKEDNFHLYP